MPHLFASEVAMLRSRHGLLRGVRFTIAVGEGGAAACQYACGKTQMPRERYLRKIACVARHVAAHRGCAIDGRRQRYREATRCAKGFMSQQTPRNNMRESSIAHDEYACRTKIYAPVNEHVTMLRACANAARQRATNPMRQQDTPRLRFRHALRPALLPLPPLMNKERAFASTSYRRRFHCRRA